jgi:colanic acid/amylovoran biosynthesis glycosyltransferase
MTPRAGKPIKKVLHFKAGPYLPVTETWIYNQINTLSRFSPIVYAVGTENLHLFPTGKVRSFSIGAGPPASGDPAGRFMARLLFHISFASSLFLDRPVLAHAHFGPSGFAFLRFKRLFGIPLVTTFYGYDLNQLVTLHPEWRERYKNLFALGDLFLVEGSHMKKTLAGLGCPEGKILVQHLGVDTDRIPFRPRSPGTSGEVRVLMSASFREKKGIPYGLEAFGRVVRNHPELHMKMTIIGDSDGSPAGNDEKEKIRSLMEQYGLHESVTLLGYKPYPVFLDELYRHHIFLSPSVHASDGDVEGGAPVSIIEASASGMPVLSTTHCDIPEVIAHGNTGYLVPERDVEALAGKLLLLVRRSDLWPSLGAAGRVRIEADYDIRKQAERLEAIYDRLLPGLDR